MSMLLALASAYTTATHKHFALAIVQFANNRRLKHMKKLLLTLACLTSFNAMAFESGVDINLHDLTMFNYSSDARAACIARIDDAIRAASNDCAANGTSGTSVCKTRIDYLQNLKTFC